MKWLQFHWGDKTLEELLSQLNKMQVALENFSERTRVQMEQKAAKITLLAAENAVHAKEIDRAEMVRENFKSIMTKPLVVGEEHLQE